MFLYQRMNLERISFHKRVVQPVFQNLIMIRSSMKDLQGLRDNRDVKVSLVLKDQ
jgi:hypothetical protein